MKTINDYAELVKEKHALNKTIAPVETDLTDASKGYHIGEQFINNGELFKAKTEIAQHDALVFNTNYEPADDLTTQIKNAGGGTGTDPRLDVFENNIAPVETDETDASRPYQVGEQLILNNILYDVIADISEHDVITTTGSGANIEPAGSISSEIQTLTNNLNDEIETRAKLGGGHNLIPYPYGRASGYTNNGYAYTYDSDGVVNVNGSMESGKTSSYFEFTGSGAVAVKSLKPSTTYRLSGGISSVIMVKIEITGDATYTDSGNGVTFTTPSNLSTCKIYIHIQASSLNNQKIYPMISLASDAYSGYTPYVPTNAVLLSADTNAVLGAHNLWAFGDVTFTTYKDFDVSNLDNGAYDFYADVVSADTSATTCMVYDATNNKALGYITRGTKQLLQIILNNTNKLRLYSSTGGAASSGKDASFSNVLLKLASDPSTEFTPYAMTNRELTEVKTGTISNGADYSTYIDSATDQSLIKVGKMCIFNYNFVMKAAADADKTVFTLSEKPTNTTRLRSASQDNNHPLDLKITTSGEVQVYQGVANTRYNGQLIFFAE